MVPNIPNINQQVKGLKFQNSIFLKIYENFSTFFASVLEHVNKMKKRVKPLIQKKALPEVVLKIVKNPQT